jgi:hypothetical protein
MSEGLVNVREVLFGLEEYLKFKDKDNEVEFTRNIVKILDSDNVEMALLNYYLTTVGERNEEDKIFRSINTYRKTHDDYSPIHDAMSRSQIRSKIWLIDELDKVRLQLTDTAYYNVLVMAGWFGQLRSIYDRKLTYRKMRFLDIDKSACETSDYIFNLSSLDNYKVKSICADINNLVLHKNGYEWDVENFKENSKFIEKFSPDLIINTSAEHMNEEWYHQIRFKELDSNPIVAIQSNNMFDGEGHINCVHSVDHMKKKFPMKEVLYEGELQLKGYKRVMIIGRP